MGMGNNAGLDLDLLDLIYELPLRAADGQGTGGALGRSADWAPVMASLRRLFAADGSLLMTAGSGTPAKLDLQGHDDAAWRRYADHFIALDPFMRGLQDGRVALNQVVTSDALLTPKQRLRDEFFNDFWRPLGIAHEVGAFCDDRQRGRLHLALSRGAVAGAWSTQQLAALAVYVRHLFRAVRLEHALRGARGPDLDVFASRFSLTPAEARLLATLCQCGRLSTAADRLGRRHNTVRAQLRAIFDKTGVHSQVALMTLLHQS